MFLLISLSMCHGILHQYFLVSVKIMSFSAVVGYMKEVLITDFCFPLMLIPEI